MKRLFIISNDYEIDLNKEWLHLIPEFSKVLHRRWLCEGDADGRKKIMAKRIFGYIYLMLDYASPLFTWEEDARRAEALRMMKLKAGDIDSDGVKDAYNWYVEYQDECLPTLKALRSMHAALRKMNTYLNDIDFDARDKQGKPLHTPGSITRAIKEMNAAYDAVATMERRVLEDLKKESNTIRGTATLGGREGKRKKEWAEGTGPMQTEIQKSLDTAIEEGKNLVPIDSIPTFKQVGEYLKDITKDQEDD